METVFLDEDEFSRVRAAAHKGGTRMWANTLTSVGVVSVLALGGDIDALRDAGQTWERRNAFHLKRQAD